MRFFISFATVILLAAGAGYWYWTTTPQYSIEQVKVALKAHNLPKFKEYFDIDSVSDGLVEDFLSQPVQRITSRDSLLGGIMQGIIGLVRPTIAPIVKDEIEQFVVSGKFSRSEARDAGGAETSLAPSPITGQPTLATFDKKFGFRNHAFRLIQNLKIEGNTALVGLLFHNQVYNRDLLLELQMSKIDNHWQVVRLTNFPDFVAKIAQMQLQN